MDDAYLEKAKKRFWAKVKKSDDPDGCWEWIGCRNKSGSGCINIGGSPRIAREVGWELAGYLIPIEARLVSRCGNAGCVNPKHMRLEFLEDRFWSKVKKLHNDSRCWEWTGALLLSGYGVFRIDGKNVRAHRFVWKLTYGFIPKGLQICHHCDNRKCVNPEHLFLGTQSDNMQDCLRKNRFGNHQDKRTNKLTQDKAEKIRKSYANGDTTQQELAIEYSVTRSHISCVINRKTWKGI